MTHELTNITPSFYDAASSVYPRIQELGLTKLLFIHNIHSKQASTTPVVLKHLEASQDQHGFDIYVDVTSNDPSRNEAMLERRVDKQTLVVVKAGDGGSSLMLSAGHQIGLDNPFGIIPAGTKNDIAHDLHSKQGLADPLEMLMNGVVRNLYPLERTSRKSGQPDVQETVLAYSSDGMSDQVTRIVNPTSYREHWLHRIPGGTWLAERAIAGHEFIGAQPYTIQQGDQQCEVVEMIVANAGHMAGDMRPFTHVLSRNARILVAGNRLQASAMLGGVMAHLPTGKKLKPGQELTYDVIGGSNDHQTDGEYILDPTPTADETDRRTISFRISDHPVNVLATSRRARLQGWYR